MSEEEQDVEQVKYTVEEEEEKGLDVGSLLGKVLGDEGGGLLDGVMTMKDDAERFVNEVIGRLDKLTIEIQLSSQQHAAYGQNQKVMFEMIKDLGEMMMRVENNHKQVLQKLKKMRISQVKEQNEEKK